MVAYGVIDTTPPTLSFSESIRDRNFELNGVVLMVKQELAENGLLLKNYLGKFGSRKNYSYKYNLWGPLQKLKTPFPSRELIASDVSLQDACLAAVAYLEPDNEALNPPTPYL